MIRYPKMLILSTLILIVGGVFGYLINRTSSINVAANQIIPTEVRENDTQYQFINPLLYVGTSKDLYTTQYQGLLSSLNTYISSVVSSNQTTDVSVYYRDMNTGHWTGIDENELYRPSSMLKVLTLMSTLRLAEDGTIALSDTLHYTPGDTSLQYYPPNDNLATGTYSVQDLLGAMTLYSDNGADLALLSNDRIDNEYTSLYKIFRLPVAISSTEDFMSARSYSAIWRTLYNATVLSDNTSEQVLHLLSLSTFKDGLVAGLPASTTIAHKFGEFTDKDINGLVIDHELHDCGIIYYPNHPYLLCIMTRGNDFPTLASVIANISKIIYTYVGNASTTAK